MAISVYGGKNECEKNILKTFQMSEQYWGCLDKMSKVNFSPAETLDSLFLIPMRPNCKLMSPEHYIFHNKSAIPLHPGTI